MILRLTSYIPCEFNRSTQHFARKGKVECKRMKQKRKRRGVVAYLDKLLRYGELHSGDWGFGV